MSRREDRSSDSKRHRSRFDREPSDQKHHRRLQDELPHEAPFRCDAKVETRMVSKESEDKASGNQESSNHSSDQAKAPRSPGYVEHDNRGSTRQHGRGFSHRTDRDRGGWRDHKAKLNNRAESKILASDTPQKAKGNREDHKRRHNGYSEMEANSKPPVRKRPSFSEKKVTAADPEKVDKSATTEAAAADQVMQNLHDDAYKSDKRDERVPYSRHSDKPEGPFARGRESSKGGEAWRGNFTSRDRYGSSGGYSGRDQVAARQGYRPTGDGGRVEKWKHDLYNEANRSPTPKNDEDHISKIEALLAS